MRFLLPFLFTFLIIHLSAQQLPVLRYNDKVRIREASNIAKKFGDRLFNGYSSVPFAILLINDSTEFLIYHPNPSDDFKSLGYDSVLGSNVLYRHAIFSPSLLATFPAVNGLSCIVVGTPETTGKNSTEWIVTLLHEHFHQYQNAWPGYYESLNNLGLSG
ncbi:MAG TPA: hypothetical protein VFV08_13835, partial [Puia sp.]|nr:hypothetical protein [Puia sp.]